MKNKKIFYLEVLFLLNLFYISLIGAISIKSNQQINSLIDNYIKEYINNNFSSEIMIFQKENKQNNSTNDILENNTNYVNNLANKTKNFNNNHNKLFNPFFDTSLEDLKIISSNFLGTIIPTSQKEDFPKIETNMELYYDCDNFENINKENIELYKKNCKIKNLIYFKDNLITNNKKTIKDLNSLLDKKFYTNLVELFQTQRLLECSNETCKPGQGKCLSDIDCECEQGFVDDPDTKINKFCSYKQKRQLLFFLIEFFAPIGIGHILNGRFLYGIIKCSVVICLIFIDLFSKCILLCGKNRGAKCSNYITFIYYGIIIFWQAYDITMIGFNKFKEDNNVPYIQVQI